METVHEYDMSRSSDSVTRPSDLKAHAQSPAQHAGQDRDLPFMIEMCEGPDIDPESDGN